MLHGTPDIVVIIQCVAAGGKSGRSELRVEAPGFGSKLAREARRNLDIARIARGVSHGFQSLASVCRVTGRVVAIRSVEKIDVASARVVALVDDLPHLGQPGRGNRASGAAYLKEFGLGKFPSLRRMRHEHALERAILAPQALYHPEEEAFCELAIAIGHAARDIQHEEDHCMHGGLTS